MSHLTRWKGLDGHLCSVVRHCIGKQVGDPHRSWRKVVKAAGLSGITRHTWRHTRATWLMQADVPMSDAAAHWMTTRTLERVCGHHHPEDQERAANV